MPLILRLTTLGRAVKGFPLWKLECKNKDKNNNLKYHSVYYQGRMGDLTKNTTAFNEMLTINKHFALSKLEHILLIFNSESYS